MKNLKWKRNEKKRIRKSIFLSKKKIIYLRKKKYKIKQEKIINQWRGFEIIEKYYEKKK